jgi:hypothetical protein
MTVATAREILPGFEQQEKSFQNVRDNSKDD